MGGMLRRVLGLGVVCVSVLAAPSLAAAAVNGSVAGWRSPAAGHMDLTVQATPDGVDLRSATATLGSLMVTESFADGSCSQSCPATLTLGVNTHDAFGQDFVGDRDLVVTVEDVNGQRSEILRRTITIDHRVPVSTPTVTVQIGSGTISQSPSQPGGGVTPDSRTSCRSPRLSMRLTDRPLRFRRGVPVLKRGRVYRYAGHLTCRINGKRRAAPRGMPVQIRNRLRAGWTVVQPSIEVRKDGDVVARLAYRSSRTIIFRVRGADGELVRVRIPIRVVRR